MPDIVQITWLISRSMRLISAAMWQMINDVSLVIDMPSGSDRDANDRRIPLPPS